MVDTKRIAALAALAEELNSQTNTINKSIHALNLELAKMNLGLEFWMASYLTDTGLQYDSYYSPPQKSQTTNYLGYAKLEDVWQLCIKEETIVYEYNRDEEREESISECAYTPLLKASRDFRLKAIEHLDRFIEELNQHALRKLETIKLAEKLAKAQ